MKMIAGFGNPETRYNFTRHNTGFLVLDFYAKVKGLTWSKEEKNGALYIKTTTKELNAKLIGCDEGPADKNEDVLIIKPQTYYNDSGLSVAAFQRYYKIKNRDMLMIVDDFTIDLGSFKLRMCGGDNNNNGMKSVIKHLKTEDIPRLKVGTKNDALRNRIGNMNFVLGKWLPEEKAQLSTMLNEATARIDDYLVRRYN